MKVGLMAVSFAHLEGNQQNLEGQVAIDSSFYRLELGDQVNLMTDWLESLSVIHRKLCQEQFEASRTELV